jgi:rare lipoprotein A
MPPIKTDKTLKSVVPNFSVVPILGTRTPNRFSSAGIGVHRRIQSLFFALSTAAALALSGCATTPSSPPIPSGPPAPDPSAFGKYYKDDGPPEKVPDNLADVPDAVPRDEPFHKYANRPYTVFGQTYAPVVNKQPTKERGLASWYGRKFHGQKTASGEPYDMFAMTAAHKTLPIPSYARVTNVKNGLSVVVRINDRGPYAHGRVIDLSKAAAQAVGIAGTEKVTLAAL